MARRPIHRTRSTVAALANFNPHDVIGVQNVRVATVPHYSPTPVVRPLRYINHPYWSHPRSPGQIIDFCLPAGKLSFRRRCCCCAPALIVVYHRVAAAAPVIVAGAVSIILVLCLPLCRDVFPRVRRVRLIDSLDLLLLLLPPTVRDLPVVIRARVAVAVRDGVT